MFIRTERLFLRPGWPEDIDDLIEALGDQALRRTVEVSALPKSREGLRDYLGKPRDPRLPHFFMYLRDAHGARLVGGIGLGRHGDEIEVGYWIAESHRGRGYALEALRAVLDHARALGHRRLVARHFSDGGATMRVLEAAGFRAAGEDQPRYSGGRGGTAPARYHVVELDRRPQPRPQGPDAALSA